MLVVNLLMVYMFKNKIYCHDCYFTACVITVVVACVIANAACVITVVATCVIAIAA